MTRIWLLPPLAALCLPACTGDTGDDTGGATGGTVEESPCGAFSSAWRPEAEWTWELDPAYEAKEEIDGGWRTVTMGTEQYAGYTVWIVQETAEYTSATYPEDGNQVEWRLICDDTGVRLVQFEGVWSRTNNIGTEDGWWSADFDDPPLLQPAAMTVGDTWEIDNTYQYSAAGTSSASMRLTASFEVTAEQSVEVGAGSFDALAVAVDWGGDPRTRFEATSYTKLVAEDVGDVQIVGRANLERWDPDPEFNIQD